MSGEADHCTRGGTCFLLAVDTLLTNSRSLDSEDRPLRERSSPLGMTELFFIACQRALKARPFKAPLYSADFPMMMGPEPRIRIFWMSVRLGIYDFLFSMNSWPPVQSGAIGDTSITILFVGFTVSVTSTSNQPPIRSESLTPMSRE